jgi:hypothetical protein
MPRRNARGERRKARGERREERGERREERIERREERRDSCSCMRLDVLVRIGGHVSMWRYRTID